MNINIMLEVIKLKKTCDGCRALEIYQNARCNLGYKIKPKT